jgi:hypothetical protein
LIFATIGTLFLVPTIYSLLKKHPPIDYTKEIDDEARMGLPQQKLGQEQQGNPQEQPA